MKHPAQPTRPVRPCRVPDYGPWPPAGFVTPQQVMAALGGCTDETLRNYEKAGLLPVREPFSGARSGWRVEVARRMVEELPARLAEAARRRQRQKAETLRVARAARKASRFGVPAQQGSATVGVLLLLAIASAAALIFDSTHAIAMAGPLLGLGAAGRVIDPDQAPEAVDQALDGERVAKRGQHAARDGFAPPDRFLHDLLDLLAADGIRLAPTTRLRAWCRTHQKHIESSPRT
jgi:hypothetical protein